MPTYKNHSAKITSLIQMIIAWLKLRKNSIYPINCNRKTTCGMIIQWKQDRKMKRIIFIYKVTVCSVVLEWSESVGRTRPIRLKQAKKMIQKLKWLNFQIRVKELMKKFPKDMQPIRMMELNLNKNKGSKIPGIVTSPMFKNKMFRIS